MNKKLYKTLMSKVMENPSGFSKKMACEEVMSFYVKEENPDLNDLAIHNSCLGIAMIELGIKLDPDVEEYLEGRGGIMNIGYDKDNEVVIQTFREFLDVLKN